MAAGVSISQISAKPHAGGSCGRPGTTYRVNECEKCRAALLLQAENQTNGTFVQQQRARAPFPTTAKAKVAAFYLLRRSRGKGGAR